MICVYIVHLRGFYKHSLSSREENDCSGEKWLTEATSCDLLRNASVGYLF